MNDLKQQELHDLSVRDVLFFFLGGALLVAISDIPNNWGVIFYVARGFLAILLFTTFVIPQRYALILLFMLALAGQDLVSSGFGGSAETGFATASIWQMGFGPINPGYIIFGCLFWQLIRLKIVTVQPFLMPAIIWFATVPIVAAIFYGGFLTEHARVEVVVDVKFALMLIGSIVLFLTYFKKDPRYLYNILCVLIGVLLARHLMDLIYVAANMGPAIATDVTRGSLDSAKGGIVFLLFLGLIFIWTKKYILLGILIAIPSIVLLIAYGTRNIWITFLFGVFVLALYLGLRRSFALMMIVVVLSFAGVWTLIVLNPTTAEVIYVRSKSLIEGRPVEKFAVAVDANIISRIDQVRYAQIFNVTDSINRRYAYLWGTGYGGYYEDTVFPFPWELDQGAFPEHYFQTGKFYRTHQFTTHMFLKHGFLGWLIIVSLWFVPGYALFKIFKSRNMYAKDQPIILNSVMLCIAAFLPTGMFQTYWSSKGLFLNGMIIASCMAFAGYHPVFSSMTASARKKFRLKKKTHDE